MNACEWPTSKEKLTTDDIRQLLHAVGLHVSDGMLKQDVRGGFLPHPERRGNRPGLWESWAIRRAVYLYRLRKLGVEGDLLRVLLFLRDGHMWAGVRPIAEKGIGKLIHATLIPARPHRSTRRALCYRAEWDAPRAKIGNTSVGMQPNAAKYIWGVLLYGQPLDTDGTIAASVSRIMCALGLRCSEIEMRVVEQVVTQLGATAARLVDTAEEADELLADRARQSLRRAVYLLRRFVRQHMKREATGPRSSSPLGGFGIPREELAQTLREIPGKLTPAQLLAALVIPGLFMHMAAESGEFARILMERLGIPSAEASAIVEREPFAELN